jgi:hypothetical protein
MHKVYLIFVGVMVLTFSIIGTLAAQGNEPPRLNVLRLDAPQANLGTTITYQGQLRKAHGPVNGNCDMTFRLFNAASNGTQIGTPVTTTVPVTNGLFTAGLDFGAASFNGEARWLEIQVKCAGDAAFTTLTPRQSIAPAPYALALPGLRTEQNNASINVVGGYPGNFISDTVIGSTISGGGNVFFRNRITENAATIGGGIDNTASGGGSTVGGGVGNTASGQRSTIPGGAGALASHYGEMAYASYGFATNGDAQTSVYVLRASIQNNQTSRELFLDGVNDRLTITNTRTLAFDILIVARSDNGKSSGWRYQGLIENDGGTTAFIGTPTKTILGEDDIIWDVDLVADDVNDALAIKGFSNTSGDTIRFVATVRTVEVSY